MHLYVVTEIYEHIVDVLLLRLRFFPRQFKLDQQRPTSWDPEHSVIIRRLSCRSQLNAADPELRLCVVAHLPLDMSF